MDTKKIFKHIPWVILGIIGAFCLSVVALRRVEFHDLLGDIQAVVAVSHQIDGNGSDHDPQGAHVFTPT
ncbi:hypothetical protein Y076_13550 [Salmonella enterica subsp. enterica serovar Infantis str. CVM N26093]|nr:hypothetical protein Y076_13550 [Salmonella enterica subsp. enterica serovar Infantis str. CVM N26093]